MAKTQTAIGIDIGAHALKAVELRRTGSHVSLVRAGTIELGELALLDDSERKNQRVGEMLRYLLRHARIRRRNVATGLAGRDYFAKYLRVPPAPPDKLRRLIEYEVAEDPSAAEGQTSDFTLLDLPSKTDDITVLIAMARNDVLRQRFALLRTAGLRANNVTLNAIGLFNAYVHAKGEDVYSDQTTLLVDIGARHMDVVVQRNAKMLFIRNLTLGGQRFSEALQEDYELPIREAEELKLTQGAILPRHFDVAAEIDQGAPETRLSAALLDPAEAVYNTLQATIKYCQTQTRMTDLRVDEVVLSGNGARLRGLREFLAHRLHTPVNMLDPLVGVEMGSMAPTQRDDVAAEGGGYSVAIGLALRDLDPRGIRPIALLPDDVARRREFFTRHAYLYGAAAVMVLAFAAMVYSSGIATDRAKEDLDRRGKLIKKAINAVEEFDLHKKRNDILAGQANALGRLLDTGRRTAEAIAILKKNVPPQLRLNTVSTITEAPLLRTARGSAKTGTEGLRTHLFIEGRVAESSEGKKIGLAAAQSIVDNFLDSLEAEKSLYSSAKVTKYPDPREAEDQRTFKMVVYFAAPFYGASSQDVVMR